jgi:hypothetical protein
MLVSGWLAAEELVPIELTIRPRAIERPELKYRLFPTETELKSGNAVPILLRLPWEQTQWMNQVFPKLQDWETRPLTAPEWENSGGVLPSHFYNELKRAAFRREALWEYPIGETQSPYMILLPDVQGLRGFLALGLSARIRYHLSRGELDKAREGILVGLANGRHLAQTPFFVNQLVARKIHLTMLERTEELIAQPKSPNLYWAITTLPELLEFQRAASLEGSLFTMTFPAVNDLDRARPAEEWRKMASQLVEFLEEIGDIPKSEPPKGDAPILEQLLQKLFPATKRIPGAIQQARTELPQLLKVSPEKVAAMSDDEVGIRWYAHLRLARDQHTTAVLALPPREAWPQLRKVKEEIQAMQLKTGSKTAQILNPTGVYVSAWSLRRRIQALRVIEAIRHHLATHDGKLPATLDAITEIPIPLDPLTDQPFLWEVQGQTASLKSPALPADLVDAASESHHSFIYKLQVP